MLTLDKVPNHLRPFVVEQDYARYSPIDQAVWRYVMRQNVAHLSGRAHEAYIEGLRKTGITIESIPSIEHMDACLSRFGWRAVSISGFIPPAAFMDFQAHGMLPIAQDIRTLDHIAYTPAPDILHESAGHAPILADEQYAAFLRLIGAIGAKALSSREDYEVYEAIRLLSIVKEDSTATPEEVAAAEANLEAKKAAVLEDSEATLISRLYWWTVEYGLIGELDAPKIYGAGLLSSVGESKTCLGPGVRKVPFDLETVIRTSYDITTEQPQLFVCESFEQLVEATEAFADRMAFRRGGTQSLEAARRSGAVATAVYASGLQVTGVIDEVVTDAAGEAIYVRTAGPTALAFDDAEILGHGRETHADGFGSPIGRLAGFDKPLEAATDAELASLGVAVGRRVSLAFDSGVRVEGTVSYLMRHADQLALIGLDGCTVTLGERVLFEAAWGTFDMAVGERVASVFAGAADKARYYAEAESAELTPPRQPALGAKHARLQQLYAEVRRLREAPASLATLEQQAPAIAQQLDGAYARDWLLRLELLELLSERGVLGALAERLRAQLMALRDEPGRQELIDNGLALVR